LFFIPLSLSLLNQFLQNKLMTYVSYASILIGLTILFSLFFILIIELNQDKKMNKYFQNHKKTKINLNNGRLECGYCGNRDIRESDTGCTVCGNKFDN